MSNTVLKPGDSLYLDQIQVIAMEFKKVSLVHYFPKPITRPDAVNFLNNVQYPEVAKVMADFLNKLKNAKILDPNTVELSDFVEFRISDSYKEYQDKFITPKKSDKRCLFQVVTYSDEFFSQGNIVMNYEFLGPGLRAHFNACRNVLIDLGVDIAGLH